MRIQLKRTKKKTYVEIDPKFFNQVSQVAHFFVGSSVVLGTLLLFSLDTLVLYVLPAFFIATAIKEFWYDRNYENTVTRGSDLEDFLFYQLGAISSLLLFIIKIASS